VVTAEAAVSRTGTAQLKLIEGVLPPWAEWLVSLGRAAVQSADSVGRLWICITLPTRSMAACLIASGVGIDAKFSPPSPANRLDEFHEGDWFTYVDSHNAVRCAQFKGTNRDTGDVTYFRKDHFGISRITRSPEMFVGLWPLSNDTEPFSHPRPLADALQYTLAALGTTTDALACTRRDAVLVGNKTEL
jgi:hypothetical protein